MFFPNRSSKPGRILGLTLAASVVAVALAAASWWEVSRTRSVILHLPEPAADRTEASPSIAFLQQSRRLPDLRYVDEAGRSHSLAELRGHPLVLNIWATWCVPCRKEMPTLDHLQQILVASDALVVPLSIDSKGPPVVVAFYREIGVRSLGIYVDSSGTTSSKLPTTGVPTALLVDREGREIGRKLGAAEWDSPEMVSLIRSHLQPRSSDPTAGQRP